MISECGGKAQHGDQLEGRADPGHAFCAESVAILAVLNSPFCRKINHRRDMFELAQHIGDRVIVGAIKILAWRFTVLNSFESAGCKREPSRGGGVFCVRIHGDLQFWKKMMGVWV